MDPHYFPPIRYNFTSLDTKELPSLEDIPDTKENRKRALETTSVKESKIIRPMSYITDLQIVKTSKRESTDKFFNKACESLNGAEFNKFHDYINAFYLRHQQEMTLDVAEDKLNDHFKRWKAIQLPQTDSMDCDTL